MINIITNVLSSFVKSQECKSNVLHMPAKLSMVKVKNELVFDIYSAASCQIKFEIFKIYVAFNCRSRSKSRLNVLVFSRKLFVIISNVTYFCICCQKFKFLNCVAFICRK